MSFQTRIMVDGAKFNSHDIGNHLKLSEADLKKWPLKEYFIYRFFVTELKVANKIENAIYIGIHF